MITINTESSPKPSYPAMSHYSSTLPTEPPYTALNSSTALILRLIKDFGVISRKDLALHSNLTPGTITAVTRTLLSKGLITENTRIMGTEGRHLTGLSLVTDKYCTISGRITPQYYAIGLFDINSNCIQIEKKYCDVFRDVDRSADLIAELIQTYVDLAQNSSLEILGIVLGLMGNFRITKSEYIMIGNDGRYIDFKRFLSTKFPFPVLCSNSNAFACYNFSCSPVFNFLLDQTVAFIDISYSIDVAIMINRQLLENAVNLPGSAGSTIMFEHSEYNKITLDDCISTQATLDLAKKFAHDIPGSRLHTLESFTNTELINAFYEEDPAAIKTYTYVADILGRYFSFLIPLVNPHKIFLVDEIPQSDIFEKMVIDSARRHLQRNASYFPEIHVLQALRRTKNDPCIIGGSLFMTNRTLQTPEWIDKLPIQKPDQNAD